jgi:hypothetical protein
MSFLYLIDEILTKVAHSIVVLIGAGLVVTAFMIALLVRHRPIAVDVVMFFIVLAGVAMVALATTQPN